MDKQKLQKAIEYAKQNPNSEFANELRKRIETGQIVVEKEQPTYLQRVGEQYSNIGERTVNDLEKSGQGYAEKAQKGDILGATGELARSGLRAVGAVTEGAFAPITEAPVIKQALDFIGEKLGNTEIGQKLAQKMQENPEKAQDIMDIINTLTIGGGKVVEKPVVTGVEKAVTSGKQALKTGIDTLKSKEATKLVSQVDDLVGKITQGTGEDLSMAKKALSDIDTTGIKSYKDLSDTLNSKIETLSSELDKRLSLIPTVGDKIKLADVDKITKVGDKIVTQNYVDDALNQLEDFYSKTNNIIEKTKIQNIRKDFETNGITVLDMNDLAKMHGRVLTGYNASGELASGLSKQAAENTRKGIKSTARDFAGDKAYKEIDNELSNIINTKNMIDTISTKVDTLKNKINQRGFGEKVGRLVFQVADKFTGGGLKGFVQSFVPRGEGLKIMNALDLERALSKNLKMLDKAMNSKTESATIKALEGILDYIENPKMGLSIEDVSKKAKGEIPETNLISEAKKYKSAEEFAMDAGSIKDNYDWAYLDEMRANKKNGYAISQSDFNYLSKIEKDLRGKESKTFYRAGDINKDGNIWLTPQQAGAEQYANAGGTKVGEYKVLVKNPLVLDNLKDIEKILGRKLDSNSYFANNPDLKDAVIEYAKKNGYDGAMFPDSFPDGGSGMQSLVVWDKSKIKTKSQLTDIWNQSQLEPKIDPLLEEAKKYKSAEEFVKAQNKTATGAKVTDTLKSYTLEDKDLGQIYRQSGLKSSAYPADFTAKNDIPKLKIKKGDKVSILANDKEARRFTIENIPERKTESGTYSKSAQIGDLVDGYSRQDQIDFINKNFSKESLTKSQLTDIWQKAHNK